MKEKDKTLELHKAPKVPKKGVEDAPKKYTGAGKALAAIIATIILAIAIIGYAAIKIGVLYAEIGALKSDLICYEKKEGMSITLEQIDRDKEIRVASYIRTYYRRISTPVADLIAQHTVAFAKAFDLPVSVLVGMMEVESAFDPSQVSNKNARGLMQVRWSVWKETLINEDGIKEEFDLHEIEQGIRAGVIVLRHYIDKNDGDMSKALYDYVGESEDYSVKVYRSMGRFMLYG